MIRCLSPEQIEGIRKDYQNGISTYHIADKYYCSRFTVNKCIKDIKRGLVYRPPKLPQSKVDKINKLLGMGMTWNKVAEAVGVSRMTVYRYKVS